MVDSAADFVDKDSVDKDFVADTGSDIAVDTVVVRKVVEKGYKDLPEMGKSVV